VARSSTTRRSASQKKDALPLSQAVTDAGSFQHQVDTVQRTWRSSWREGDEGLERIARTPGRVIQDGARFAKWRAVIAVAIAF